MHVFLTGDVQVGKSTAIGRFLDERGLAPLGFRTLLDREAGILNITVISKNGNYSIEAAKIMKNGRPAVDIECFNEAGERLAALDTEGCSLLIMDELGFMERDAEVFKAAVKGLLDRGIPAVGVLRNRTDGPFWDYLHAREDVKILTVTEENRDSMPDMLYNSFTVCTLQIQTGV